MCRIDNPSAQIVLNQTHLLRDGRRMGYAEFGDSVGFPVIYCHGFPASRLEGALIAEAASRHRARVIAIDRPGYGLSDQQAHRQLLNWPEDVVQLLDHLGIKRFAVLAVSGGGPYGLALSAKLADRISATSLVCPLGPVFRSDLVMAMHWPARLGFFSARHAPWLTKLVYGQILGALLRSNPSFALSLLTVAIPAVDRAILAQDEVNQIICRSIREALRPGWDGALRDFHIYSHDWGFDLSRITSPIVIWHGETDATVPISHSRALVTMLVNAEFRTLLGEGHFSLPIGQAHVILTDLLEKVVIYG